jgi:hypothetical protein
MSNETLATAAESPVLPAPPAVHAADATAAAAAADSGLQLPPPCEDEFLDNLTGDWVGKYTLAGVEFESHSQLAWVFNHQFVRGLNQSRGAIGLAESSEIWQPTKEPGVYKLWWFDPWGNAGLAHGRSTPTGWFFEGFDPAFGKFRNTITRKGDDYLDLRMEAGPDENDQYSLMGTGFYRRVGT